MIKKCGIILYDIQNKKYFLVKGKKSNKWGFPKGHMEEGESEIDTARREFYEETGYNLPFSSSMDKKYIVKNNIYFIVIIEHCNDLIQISEEIPDKNEIQELKWLSINDILSKNIKDLNFGLKTWILNKKYSEFF